jgi:diguanylate cyclase (GGDEF)-like protein
MSDGRHGVEPSAWRGSQETGTHRLPLMASFGVLSLVLTVALGLTLGIQIRHQVQRRSAADLTATTESAIAITANNIVSGLATGHPGPSTPQQKTAQAGVITSASRALVAHSDVVAVEAVLADGTVIGGSDAPAVGATVSPEPGFGAALHGVNQVRTMPVGATGATRYERRLLGRYGALLVLQQGVRLTPGAPILAVVRSYTPLAPTNRQAAADIRSIIWFLLLGLFIFWVVLFRLVLGASRALTRQSKANVHLATHDALTGLPNRVLLRDRTERAVLASRRTGRHVGLILLDLDRFKDVNDALGHQYGDLLLRQIGSRLREHLRGSDTIARLGGDEFVVMLPDLVAPHTALEVAEKLSAAILQPFLLEGVLVDVGSSAGVVTTPDHGDDFDELMQHADAAMYAAKRDGLEVVAYDPIIGSSNPAKLSLLSDLRSAVEQSDQVLLYYQPQARLATGQIAGVEALVRWQHPVHGLLAPDEFIPLAERTGIIRPLTWCILRTALEQNRRWAEEGLFLRVSVNISTRSLLDSEFCARVAALLAETGVPAPRLELELTETTIMTDPDHAMTALRDLAALGIRLSIDDFGTGYSSLAYLKALPVRELKIDRTFITGMETDASDAAIVRYCLELARNLDLTVVAEGVETHEVWQHLTELGCPMAQGFFLSRPLPAAAVGPWMAEHQLILLPDAVPSG